MKIGEMFRAKEAALYPTPDEILTRELEDARKSYPNAPSDLHALAFASRTLKKNLAERTAERDKLRGIR